LKLELAQYREIAAFAQFGSDLDEATLRLLNRGAHLTELLKQPQYTPFPVEQQIISIFAATKGFFDSFELTKVATLERDLLQYVTSFATFRPFFALLSEEIEEDAIFFIVAMYFASANV